MKIVNRILVFCMFFILLEPALLSIRASAVDSIELVPIANKMIDDTSVYPGGYFDGQDLLIVGYQKIEGTVFGYSESMLKFDVSSIDPARIIQSATLEFYVKSVFRTPDERMDMQPHLNLYGSNNDGWQEDGIRVNLSKDYPIVVGQELVNGYPTYSFDVKNFIVSQVDDGMATFVLTGRQIPSDLLSPTETNAESAFTVFARDTDKPPRLLIEYAPNSAPIVETGSATQIAVNSAMISAEVVSSGGEVMTERGIEFRKSGTSDYMKVVAGVAETGNYTVELTGLSPNTSYEVRAFATNALGTSYGSVMTFTTNDFAATMSADQSLTEENLHERKLTVTLSDTTFQTPLNAGDFTLQNAPNGLTISQVERMSDTEAIVTLSFDGTDFDSDHSLGLTIAGTALTSNVVLTVTPPLTIIATKDPEFITLSQLDDIWEGEENGKVIVVTLQGGTFAKTLNSANWTVSNLPSGVSKGTVVRVDAKTVHITLNGNATAPYVGDIPVTVSLTKNEYDDSTGGGSLSASGIVLKAHQAPTVVTGTATEIAARSVTLGGEVMSEGTKPVTEQGIEYRKSGSSDNYMKLVAQTVGSGTFAVEATSLKASTTYEYRAYATNGKGTTYDVLKEFSTMALSQNADLQNIVLNTGRMNEPFSPNDLRYTANVGNHVREVQITATTADLFATMKVNGQQVASGHPSQLIPLAVGNNKIVIEVEAEDGTKKTYMVTVYRKPTTSGWIPSSNANLANLAVYIDEDNLLEKFSTDETAYHLETEADSIDIAFDTSHNGASIFVNDTKVDGRMQIDLEDGENTIEIVVHAENGEEKKYTLTVIKTLPKNPFSDINNHWAYDYIIEAFKLGIFNGYPDSTFKPERKLERMHTAMIFANLLDLKTEVEAPFLDIEGYEAEAIAQLAAMYEAGLIHGYPDGTFGPRQPVTRAQFSLIAARIYENETGKPYEPSEIAPFIDIVKYDDKTQKAITLLYDRGIVEGYNNNFMPTNSTTRGQAAKMLVLMKQLVDELNKNE